jgi:hypothetical protein
MCNCCVYLLVVPEVGLLKQVGLTRFCLHGKLISSFCSFSIMVDWEFKNLLYSLLERNESC